MLKRLLLLSIIWHCLSALAWGQVQNPGDTYPHGLPPHLAIEPRKGEEINKKIQGFLKRNFHRLIDNTGNIQIASEEFGIDQLVVAKVVFGIQRLVEKNPWPTGKDDQFLVKDEMTIGFRLGAGFVVFGDISYIKKYILVQPVASHREGMLKNDFIVNLMLPLHVVREKLPEKYVLMTESYFEGRGRIKLGGGIAINPFIHQSHHSRISLSRTYIDNRRPDIMRVFVDEGAAREWGQLFYITAFEFLSYTLFKGSIRKGENNRSYYEVPKNLPEYSEILHKLCAHNEYDILEDYALERRVNDRFRQGAFNLNIFGLYNYEHLNRYDEIKEFMADSNGEWTLINQQYQQENERELGWSSIFSGEEFFSNILFLAYNDEDQLGKPHLVITTRINDKRARPKEVYKKYIDALNRIALRTRTLELAPESRQLLEDERVRATMDMRIKLDDKAVEMLLNLDEDTFWEHIDKITGIESKRWQEEMAPVVARLKSDEDRPDIIRPAKRRLKRMSKRLRAMKDCDDNPCRIKEFTRLVRDGVYIKKGRFAPDMLSILHSFTQGHMSIEASLNLVKDNKIIDTALWDNKIDIVIPQKFYRFNFVRATEIYHLFSEGA